MKPLTRLSLSLLMLLASFNATRADDGGKDVAPNSPNEPPAKTFSMAKAAEFLDHMGTAWTNERQCGSCHSNYAYLMARPYVKLGAQEPHREVREFFEGRVKHWDDADKAAKPKWDAEVIGTATILAFNDAATSGKLHPATKAALDRMWSLQKPNGAFNWLKCDWPPYEADDYYGATFAALGAAVAPENYFETPQAKKGLENLRRYFTETPAPSLHHQAMRLWVSTKLDGFMSQNEKAACVNKLRSLQRADGGWNLPSLGDWKRRDGKINDKNAESDGFGTGFVVYVLRQSGVAADDPAVSRGVAWLKSHQRESGRWFTRSLNNDKAHYITHAGTAFAILAIASCEPVPLKAD